MNRQGGWIHALLLALVVAAAIGYVGLPFLLATICEPEEPPPPLAVVLRDGDQYCLWLITPTLGLAPLPEHPTLKVASVQRCTTAASLLQREADIFNGTRLPAAEKTDPVDCKRPHFLNLINDANRWWGRWWKK